MNFNAKLIVASFLLLLPVGMTVSFAATTPDQSALNEVIQLDKQPASPKLLPQPPLPQLPDPPLQGHISDTVPSPGTASPASVLSPEDTQNIASLWKLAIAKNPVIQYGLKELSTPPELRYAHASVMSRVIGGMLAGASILPYLLGGGQYEAGATSIGANMVDRAMTESQKIDPDKLPSDTELVQLSGIIQSIQRSLAENYLQYKSDLMVYAHLTEVLATLNTPTTASSAKMDPFKKIWAQEQALSMQEQLLETSNDAKQHFLLLERLVGVEGVKNLRFGEQTNTAQTEKAEKQEKAASVTGAENRQ
jgi:hypothetical protein